MNYSFKCRTSRTFPRKKYFLEVCEEHFDFFKVRLCCQSIALYMCCVMGKFASLEVIFFPSCSALSAQAYHYMHEDSRWIQRFCLWPFLFHHSLHAAGFVLQGFSAFYCMKMTFAQVQNWYTIVCLFHSLLSGLSAFFLVFEYHRRQSINF